MASCVFFFKKKNKTYHKIFGIGAHKTGTTSLAEALVLLGIKTSHWNDFMQIREDRNQGKKKLRILKKVDALVDLPVPNFYKELDKTYPGSKFILTIRDAESWVKSVENHLKITQQEFSRNGMNYIDEEAEFYQQKTFDSKQAKHRLKNHEDGVLQYFKHRPNDLLIMNITNGDGWEKLCAFLKIPPPDLPFPAANLTANQKMR